MPMKAMAFKTLSTVIDDLFAFCIKMPILHRLACFRDDVVFCVFLYQVSSEVYCTFILVIDRHDSQRWIYRIDPKRVNEYGQVMVEDTDAANAADETKESKKSKKSGKPST